MLSSWRTYIKSTASTTVYNSVQIHWYKLVKPKLNQIFIESAHWADSIIESRCPYVCLCVCLCVCPLPMQFFLRGRTGVDRHSSKNSCGASATRGALKTGRCSELDASPAGM